jgi:hypothetical protein
MMMKQIAQQFVQHVANLYNIYMNNEITINELLKGKSTIIKNKEFFPTKTYVEPFLERMSKFTDDFRINIKLPDQITTHRDNRDITYNRVLIQAVLPPEHCIDNHDEVMGLVYGIDVRKPVAKIYRGYLNKACTNLAVFTPQWINTQELIPGEPIDYKPIKHLMEHTNNFNVVLKKMKETTVNRDDRTQMLGKWVDASLRECEDYGFGKVKIAVTTPIDAYKQLFINQDSEYYIPEGIDPTLFDIHNSFTQLISHDARDLMNRFEKVMIVNKLLGIN